MKNMEHSYSYIDPKFDELPKPKDYGLVFIAEETEDFYTGFLGEYFRRVRRAVLIASGGQWVKLDSFLYLEDAMEYKEKIEKEMYIESEKEEI